MNIFTYAYNTASASAKALGFTRIKHKNSRYSHRPNNVIVNWGSTNLPEGMPRVLNKSNAVRIVRDKLAFLTHLKIIEGVNVIPFTTDIEEAKAWNTTVVERHTLTGNSGQGIKIKEPGEALEACPLYTKYIPKEREYRVHMVGDTPVRGQRKTIKRGTQPKTWKVRSHDNGFIFVIENNLPRAVLEQVNLVHNHFRTVGLTFAAYDVIVTKSGKAYVLEGNTAPGIEGETVNIYRRALTEEANKL